MRKPKLGGNKTLRLFLKGDENLTATVFGPATDGHMCGRRLSKLIHSRYCDAFQLEVIHEAGARADVILQEVERPADVAAWRRQGLNEHADTLAQQRTRLFEQPTDVVVFSLQPDVMQSAWKHRDSELVLRAPTEWSAECVTNGRQRLTEAFVPTGFISAEQFTTSMRRLVQIVKGRLDAHVLVFNCSSLDPDDHTHNYHGLAEDPVAVRVHRLNLALMELSRLEGISIIDVERLVAEMGGQRHVSAGFSYSEEAYEGICAELLRVLEDIGFFEKRPLVMQLGQEGVKVCS
jgi:hypothetical protein